MISMNETLGLLLFNALFSNDWKRKYVSSFSFVLELQKIRMNPVAHLFTISLLPYQNMCCTIAPKSCYMLSTLYITISVRHVIVFWFFYIVVIFFHGRLLPIFSAFFIDNIFDIVFELSHCHCKSFYILL